MQVCICVLLEYASRVESTLYGAKNIYSLQYRMLPCNGNANIYIIKYAYGYSCCMAAICYIYLSIHIYLVVANCQLLTAASLTPAAAPQSQPAGCWQQELNKK